MESVEDRCRKKLAKIFNHVPISEWVYNSNTGRGYISGRPDAEVRLSRARIMDIECKGSHPRGTQPGWNTSIYLGDPDDKDATAGWHYHQRRWYEDKIPFQAPYFIGVLCSGDPNYSDRFDFALAGMFLVPPEAWLALEAAVFPRKTVSLSPQLERVHEHKSITLESAWAEYRLPYVGQKYIVPEHHPVYKILKGE
jgi:hypothetical protein